MKVVTKLTKEQRDMMAFRRGLNVVAVIQRGPDNFDTRRVSVPRVRRGAL